MLLLKKHLVELVRAGKKTQTIRVWTRALVRAGMLSYTPGLGKVRIVAVEEVAGWEALSEADAVADGFANRAALLRELHGMYGETVPEGRHIYRIRFAYPALPSGDEAAFDSPTETVSQASGHEALPVVMEVPAVVRRKKATRKRSAGADEKPSAPETAASGKPGRAAHLMDDLQCQRLRQYVLERRPGKQGATVDPACGDS